MIEDCFEKPEKDSQISVSQGFLHSPEIVYNPKNSITRQEIYKRSELFIGKANAPRNSIYIQQPRGSAGQHRQGPPSQAFAFFLFRMCIELSCPAEPPSKSTIMDRYAYFCDKIDALPTSRLRDPIEHKKKSERGSRPIGRNIKVKTVVCRRRRRRRSRGDTHKNNHRNLRKDQSNAESRGRE